MSSFRKFDYRVRPAKQIERKMIGECLSRLSRIGVVADYPYVGFGSVAFMDFVMMHRLLGSKSMVSIEHSSNALRMENNRPYRCIEVKAGNSHDQLVEIDWSKPSIVWLDYDSSIDENKILDVGLCAERLPAGSFLLVTLPYEGAKDLAATEKAFLDAVPTKYVSGFARGDFSGERYAKVLRTVLTREISHRLGSRGAGGEKDSEGQPLSSIVLNQVLFFTYRDSTRMLTLGWFVDDELSDPRLLDRCGFNELETYRMGEEAFSIKPPVLTPHEIRMLNSQLPPHDGTPPTCPGIPEQDVRAYRSVYRYFPIYFEVMEA